jgi:VIT1/CCC1 family predicted Fe2+/Mn2+ transporter
MRGRLITAALLVLVGLVWIGQGLGLLRGSSFMVDDLRWTGAGLVAVAIGAVLALSARRRGRPRG